MVVTVDNNLTEYHYAKNCVVKIRKIYKDNVETYLFSYGFVNSLTPKFSVWSTDLPLYYSSLVRVAFDYVGFDSNFLESDIRSLVSSIRNYLKRNKLCMH